MSDSDAGREDTVAGERDAIRSIVAEYGAEVLVSYRTDGSLVELCDAATDELLARLRASQPIAVAGTGEREALRAVLAEAEAALNVGRIDPRMTHIVLIASAALAVPAPVVAPETPAGVGDCEIAQFVDFRNSEPAADFRLCPLEGCEKGYRHTGACGLDVDVVAAAQPEPSEPNADADIVWSHGLLTELSAAYYNEGAAEHPDCSARQRTVAAKHASEVFARSLFSLRARLRAVQPREQDMPEQMQRSAGLSDADMNEFAAESDAWEPPE